MTKLKTLVFDIETSPIVITTYGLYGEKSGNHKEIVQDWSVLSVAWKWLGEETVYYSAIDHKDPKNDANVIAGIHAALSEADIIVGHNVGSFDWKKLTTRFLFHGYKPIPKARVADTYRIAKREFNFTSNRLDYIATYLGLGAKMDTPKGLWQDVMAGKKGAIQTMIEYNIQDVHVTEAVYKALLPFDSTAANRSSAEEGEMVCPKCGGVHYHARGYSYTSTSKKQRYQCLGCGGWFTSKKNLLTTTANLTRSA